MAQRWSQYSSSYQQALLNFRADGFAQFGPMPLKRARALKTSLYTYRNALQAGLKSDQDFAPILIDLIDIFSEIMLSIDPSPVSDDQPLPDEPLFLLRLCRNPLVEAMSQRHPTTPSSAVADNKSAARQNDPEEGKARAALARQRLGLPALEDAPDGLS